MREISNHDIEVMKKGCFGKIAHKTITAAQYYLDKYTASAHFIIYRCKYCKWYHLGHDATIIPKTKK